MLRQTREIKERIAGEMQIFPRRKLSRRESRPLEGIENFPVPNPSSRKFPDLISYDAPGALFAEVARDGFDVRRRQRVDREKTRYRPKTERQRESV